MTEQDFEKAKDFLEFVVEGSQAPGTGFGPGEFGFTVDPGNVSKEQIEEEFFRHENDADWKFEKGDVLFERGIVENGLKVFIIKLSPELIEKTKIVMKKDN